MIINNKYQFNHHIYNTLHNRDFSVGYVIQVINNLCVIIGNNACIIKRWFIRTIKPRFYHGISSDCWSV